MKPAKCKVCHSEFIKRSPFQKWCSVECGAVLAVEALTKKKARQQAAERKQTREKLKAMETYPQLVKKAQTAFNAFIRARDAGKPCISCDKPLGDEPNTYDSGHFRSVGSAPHMRFVEDNAAGQCKRCNNYLSGNHVEYRKGLIERIGIERVEQLERDQTIRKYTREGLIELAKHYRDQARRLKK